MNKGLNFQDFLNTINAVSENDKRQEWATQFLGRVLLNGYPHFEGPSTAVLFYQGDVEKVALIGDPGNWMEEILFRRISGTNIYYLVLNPEKNARLEYLLKINDNINLLIDPMNPYIVHNGFGPNSELAMPGYERLSCFSEYEFGKKGELGALDHIEIEAGILPYAHEVLVYLPPDYQKSGQPCTAIYVQDGKDYVEFALTPVLLDDLIRSKKIKPVVAVFINPPNRHQPKTPNRMTEYGMNDDYVNFMADELVPVIEERYNLEMRPGSRLVAGDSFGGLISAYVPFLRPDVFGLGCSQSGYQSFQNDRLIRAYQTSAKKPVRLYVDVGTYEKVVGAGMLPDDETDFLEANRRFEKVLKEKKYDYIYREYPEGHTWGNWRTHLADALIHFFGISND